MICCGRNLRPYLGAQRIAQLEAGLDDLAEQL